jgi:hypothetical protein
MSKRPIGRPKTRWEDDFWKIVGFLNVLYRKSYRHSLFFFVSDLINMF